MKNDQHFEPGDKVMRVSRNNLSGRLKPAPMDAEDGKIYAVEKVWERKGMHFMKLCGFPPHFGKNGVELGFACMNFRRVEEIQLCVQAARAAKKQDKQEAQA